MADIEKDYKIALAKGKSEREAQAKRDQRIADTRDDYAKHTGADRTQTRAAESAAEKKLSASRRAVDKDFKPVSALTEGSKPLTTAKMDTPEVKTPDIGKSESKPKATRRAPRRAAAPAKKPATAPAKKETPSYRASFGAPSVGAKPKGKPQSVGRRMMTTSAKRQQGQMDQLGGELKAGWDALTSPFRRIREAGEKDDKVRGYAKGGMVDGCAVRGKTKATRKK